MPKEKKIKPVIDSKYLKVLSVKKSDLADSIVFVCLDETKYGALDKSSLRKIVQHIDKIEPSGVYFPLTKRMDVKIFDLSEFKNKDILVTIRHEESLPESQIIEIESNFRRALGGAKNVRFIHALVEIEDDS